MTSVWIKIFYKSSKKFQINLLIITRSSKIAFYARKSIMITRPSSGLYVYFLCMLNCKFSTHFHRHKNSSFSVGTLIITQSYDFSICQLQPPLHGFTFHSLCCLNDTLFQKKNLSKLPKKIISACKASRS